MKLKNIISKALSETDLHKEHFKEPRGMVDVDLKSVIVNKLEVGNNHCKKSVKYRRNTALLFLIFWSSVLGALGCFIFTVIIINNSSVTVWHHIHNSSSGDSVHTTNFLNEENVKKVKNLSPSLFDLNRRKRNNDLSPQNIKANKNVSIGICPTYNSPLGYPILQQQVSPNVYHSNQASLQSGQLPSQFGYSQSFSQVPSYYGTSLTQSNQTINLKTLNGHTHVCYPIEYYKKDVKKSSNKNSVLQHPLVLDNKNKTRASTACPLGEISCEDNSNCIKVHKRCDGEIDCKDATDETLCPCKTRLSKSRLCDGYLDCPNGEDELRCFGCELGTFSCDDWSPRVRGSTCIPLEQRCDGIAQCPTEIDEIDCSRLEDTFSTNQHFVVSKAMGFLYKNFKGRWYPTCHNTQIWAIEACKSEIGPNTIAPLISLVPVPSNYNGFYASGAESDVDVIENCENGLAAFVECPPLVCGLRIKEQNPFRREEVDTSAETILGVQINVFSQSIQNKSDPILGSGRVVGGKPSQPKAWPWIISVYRNGVFHCGGAIINEFWIVTAAHCVDKYWNYYYEIQAGVLRRYSYAPMVQNRIVSNIVAHQFYDKRKLKNDIALMKTSNPLEFNRYVKPICLPSEITAGRNFIWGPEPGTLCTAVGWGAMAEHGTDPDHLREVQVPVHKKCKHQEDEEGKEICAGLREGGKDACQGDSGGPFMCRNPNLPNQWYLAGIVSHGEGCARPNEPGVYTRVSLFLEWIFENIRAEILPIRKPLHRCPGYVCKDTNTCLPNKRRCDKIVDCLQGDDEIDCHKNTFTEMFRRAMHNIFLRNEEVGDATNITLHENDGADNDTMQSIVDISDGPSIEISTSTFEIINTETTSATVSSSPRTYILETIETTRSDEPSVSTTESENELSDSETKATGTDNALHETTTESEVVPSKGSAIPLLKFPKMQETTFKCKTILQIIEINNRCDRKADCEDGSDEHNCTCVDYLKYKFPNTICDGETNCLDMSDEQDCSKCLNDEYHCRSSNKCIKKRQWCDNKRDCPLGEDETDCFALTDGKIIKMDDNLRPQINISGIVTINHIGNWQIFCSNWTRTNANVAADICFHLGFSDYSSFKTIPINNKPLDVQYKSTILNNTSERQTDTNLVTCTGLYVKCADKVDIKHHFHEADTKPLLNVEIPWNTEIYVEGVYKCTGVLLEFDWVITASGCFGEHFSWYDKYISVLLGNSKSYLNVTSPQEQILRVIDFLQVYETSIVLLRLEKKISFTRYVRPIGFEVKNQAMSETEMCLAQGASAINNTNLVYFKPIRNCPNGERCFRKEKMFLDNCYKGIDQLQSWSGCIVCRSIHGWYPAAVYHESFGGCGFSEYISYTDISYWKRAILTLIRQNRFVVDTPKCDGVRCSLGKCISKNNVCDGVEQCRDGADEGNCLEFRNNCSSNGKCGCLKSEIKCKNGNCVPKSTFCDRNNDCGDWSDEPDECNCKTYLSLTQPEKVCDGIRNCYDRSDEDPNICKCRLDNFLCTQSKKCVSQDVVCDGMNDCPNGEDETECLSIVVHPKSGITEVQQRTAGVWHPGCYPKYLTTLQLEEICSKMGFTGRSAKKLNPESDINKQSGHIVMDVFNGIWIRPNEETKLLVIMRNGARPYVQLKADPKCHRLFLQCL